MESWECCVQEELGLTDDDYQGGNRRDSCLNEEYPLGMDIREALGLMMRLLNLR